MKLRKIATLAALATVTANRNSEDSPLIFATQDYPVDGERRNSKIDSEKGIHTKEITDNNSYEKIILKSNLELFDYLQLKGLCEDTLRPKIIKITARKIISELIKFDPETEISNLIASLENNPKLRNDVALLSLLGIGDLAPNYPDTDNKPIKNGEVNMVTKDGNKLQIIDLDSLGMEIDMSEFFYYGVDAFKNALEVLKKDPELKTKSLERLIEIFPKMDKDKIERLFDERIELIEKATEGTIASKDDFLNLQKFLDEDTNANRKKLNRLPTEIQEWFFEIKRFNYAINDEERIRENIIRREQFANQVPRNHVIEPESKVIKSKNPSREL